MTASIMPPARTVFVDNNGVPLVGGKIYTYIPNTSTLKTTWQNAQQTILNQNPIQLDSNGSCLFYGSGEYYMVLEDVDSNLIWNGLTTAPNSTIGNTYLNVQAQFGAAGDGVTDDTVAVQAGLTYIASTGGCLYFPTGVYKITAALSANFTNTAYTSTQRPALIGDGSGLSVLAWAGANNNAVYMLSLTRNESSGTPASFALCTIQGIGMAPLSNTYIGYVRGLYLSKWPFMTISDLTVHQLYVGIHLDQCLNMQFNRCVWSNNSGYGFVSVGAPASPNSALYANNCILLLGCIIGANAAGGATMTDTSFQMINGTVEYNGQGAVAGEGYGVYVNNGGTDGASAVACIFDGVYFEGNGTTGAPGTNPGYADIWINHNTAWNSQSYIFRGNFFNRLSTNYANYCIFLNMVSTTNAIMNIENNQFQYSSGYTPTSSNPYTLFYDDGAALSYVILDARANGFGSSTEFPDWVAQTEFYQGQTYRGGALVYTNASQTLTTGVSGATTILTFGVAAYNNYDIWNSGSPTLLTVPANVSQVKLTGSVLTSPTTYTDNIIRLNIFKNGSTSYAGHPQSSVSAGSSPISDTIYSLNVSSAIIQVSPGDYFTLEVGLSGTNNLATSTADYYATYFSMEIIS